MLQKKWGGRSTELPPLTSYSDIFTLALTLLDLVCWVDRDYHLENAKFRGKWLKRHNEAMNEEFSEQKSSEITRTLLTDIFRDHDNCRATEHRLLWSVSSKGELTQFGHFVVEFLSEGLNVYPYARIGPKFLDVVLNGVCYTQTSCAFAPESGGRSALLSDMSVVEKANQKWIKLLYPDGRLPGLAEARRDLTLRNQWLSLYAHPMYLHILAGEQKKD